MVDGKVAVEVIRQKFERVDRRIMIPLQKGRSFKATMTDEGIIVDNLGSQPLLPWIVFEEAIDLLIRNGGRAEKGNAMASKLGEEGLPVDSIEGHIALTVYGKKPEDSVFRRISPISAILVWAGLCDSHPGELLLC
jgi:hypothetical protein